MRSGTTLNDFMQWDNTLFDDIILPSGIDHGLLVSSIMLRCGLQNPLYEHYDVFKSQVKIWFAAHEWNFARLVRLVNEEYNPLWNKDGYETREIDHTRDETETVNRDIDETRNTKRDTDTTETIDESVAQSGTTTTTDDITKNGTDTHSVKGFNATDWQETDRNVSSDTTNGTSATQHGLHTDTDGNNSEVVDETIAETGTTSDDVERTLNRGKTTETVRAYGNIGVTRSQEMFRDEAELLHDFNLYEFIAKKFDDDLMIGVYVY